MQDPPPAPLPLPSSPHSSAAALTEVRQTRLRNRERGFPQALCDPCIENTEQSRTVRPEFLIAPRERWRPGLQCGGGCGLQCGGGVACNAEVGGVRAAGRMVLCPSGFSTPSLTATVLAIRSMADTGIGLFPEASRDEAPTQAPQPQVRAAHSAEPHLRYTCSSWGCQASLRRLFLHLQQT